MKIDHRTLTSLKRTGLALSALALVLIITAAVERKKEMVVTATVVDVEPLAGGYWLIDSADVIKIIERNFGMSLDEQAAHLIDEDRVERVLEEDAFVKNAEVTLGANSQLRIDVKQREPILRIIDNVGASYYIDADGNKIPTSPHFTARTLVATGDIQPHTPEFLVRRQRHSMRDLYELTHFIIADDLWRALFEQIYVNSRGEFVLIPKVGDQTIIFGDLADVESKFRRLKIFYEEAMSREGWQKYHSIDLRYRGQVVCEKN